MKKSIISLLFLLAVCAFSTNMVYAGEPIDGVDTALGKNPGGIVFAGKTGRDGKFSCKIEKGSYLLSISFAQIDEILRRKDKEYASNPKGYTIDLFQCWPTQYSTSTIQINRETREINIIAKEGGNYTATLTYTKLNAGKANVGTNNENKPREASKIYKGDSVSVTNRTK
ncbi:MAG: hypothetical protein NTY07_04265 [Bacteroidia bacterium]|nr:hypothetical protein [Bacteroidia bacterium]